MSQTTPLPTWSEGSHYYGKYMDRMTIKGAKAMVEAVAKVRPVDKNSRFLDDGTGPGTGTKAIRHYYPDVPIVATDLAPGMVALASKAGWSNVTWGVADATNLDRKLVPDESFTHLVSPLMIQFCGDKQINVVSEAFRALVPGGAAAISISYDITIPDPWNKACQQLDPNYQRIHTHEDKAWMTEERLAEAFKEVGFEDVHYFAVRMDLPTDGVEDFMDFFLNGEHPAFSRDMSSWKGDRAEVVPVFEKVLREQYKNPPDVGATSGIVVGRKPTK